MKRLRFTDATRLLAFVVLGATGAWVLARWLWPWCGPWLLRPCPLPTPIGEGLALLAGGVFGLIKALDLEAAERSWERQS